MYGIISVEKERKVKCQTSHDGYKETTNVHRTILTAEVERGDVQGNFPTFLFISVFTRALFLKQKKKKSLKIPNCTYTSPKDQEETVMELDQLICNGQIFLHQ